MKQITAVIPPHRLSTVVNALHERRDFPGFTVLPVRGQGRDRGAGGASDVGLLYHEKQLLLVWCEDAQAQSLARTIAAAAHTGKPGDGIVAVTSVESYLRVRDAHPGCTGDHND